MSHDDNWFKHSAEEGAAQEAHGDINAPAILAFLAIVIIFVAGVFVAVPKWFGMLNHSMETAAETDPTLQPVRVQQWEEMQAGWNAQLAAPPVWIDTEAGTVQLPLDQAADAVVRRYRNAQ